MDEAGVVASIVAGDLAVLAELLDQSVAPLFSFCRSMLPEDEAADAVENTFIIARVKVDGLRDPARLGAWLQAVARSECFRRLIAKGELPPAFIADVADAAAPAGLRGKILKVCTDDTATARAHRMSVAHQAGQFGHDGFPRPVVMPKPGTDGRNGRRLILALTGGVVTVAVAVALVFALGSHSSRAVAAGTGGQQGGLGGVTVPTSASATVTAPGSQQASPTAHATTQARHSSPAAAPTPTPVTVQVTLVPPTPASTSPAPSPTPRHTQPPPTPTPAGTLQLSTTYVVITSVRYAPASRVITLTAMGGPVAHFSISIDGTSGYVSVSPLSGSLAAGQQLDIVITGRALFTFTDYLTFSPGGEVLAVHVQARRR